MWKLTKTQGIPATIQGSPTMLSNNACALLDAAKAGLGITCLPRFLIQPALAAGHLQIFLPEYSSPEIPISVVYPSKRYLTPKVSVFINLLSQRTNNILL
ncbi:LysR substrate-binding domain-containing protein [Gluconobacter cerinus]|uniref:LysR substrate-binding domain-containing protein n=1 Tax=Gluconobacter cerinus TaxID=38307 RepID=UPI0038D16932